MRYKITLKPLEPFLFGGDNTFGKIGDKENGTYLVKSRQFPQQSAILGMLKKEMMIQDGVLSRKVRGEWVDKHLKNQAKELVGFEKFNIALQTPQDFGRLKSISPIFLQKDDERFIKKVDIDSFKYKEGLLEGYSPKKDIYDNFVSLKSNKKLSSDDIFQEVEQTGNKKGGEDNSLFKKTSYILKDDFRFALYIESEYELRDSIVSLGADGSKFYMQVKQSDEKLDYADKNGYLTLLSDAYITVALKGNCEFAITSEISYQNLQNKKHVTQKNEFKKSKKVYLYEKGSVFINPEDELINNLNNKNCQKIGYNTYSYKGQHS